MLICLAPNRSPHTCVSGCHSAGMEEGRVRVGAGEEGRGRVGAGKNAACRYWEAAG